MTLALGAIGAVAGSFTGQAMLGWSIGTTIGNALEMANQPGVVNEVGALSDLKISGSNYGVDLPKVWGRVMVPGTLIWAAQDADGNHLVKNTVTTRQGGKGGPSVTTNTYTYTATYAMAFCEGTQFFEDPTDSLTGTLQSRNHHIVKIYADDVLIWTEGGGDANQVTVRVYAGTYSQSVDSTIQAVEGTGYSSAYRGIVYCVIEDHLLTDFSNRIPNIRAEVVTDAVTAGTIFSDVCRSCMIPSSRIDVTGATETIRGYILGGRATGQDSIGALAGLLLYDTPEVNGVLKFVKRGQSNSFTITEDELGSSLRNGLDSKVEITHKKSVEIPSRIEFTYVDIDRNYEQVMQSDIIQSSSNDASVSISTSLTMTSSEARQLQASHLDTAQIEDKTYAFSVPRTRLNIVPSDCGLLPTQNGLMRVRILSTEIGDPGEIRITAIGDNNAVISQSVTGGDSSTGGSIPDTTIVPTTFYAWSGREILTAHEGSAGFYVVGTAVGADKAKWKGASIYYSTDAGSTWVLAGSLNSKGIFGLTDSTLASGTAGTWDYTNDVDVILNDDGQLLEPATAAEVLAGFNIAKVGDEYLGFSTPTLTSPNEYTLSDLYRGVKETTTGSSSGARFVLFNETTVARIVVPDEYIGDSLQIKAVSLYEDIADVTAQTITIATKTPGATDAILAAAVYPAFLGSAHTVYSAQTTGIAWTTKDLSAVVPVQAKFAILEVRGEKGGPDSGSINTDLWVRKDSGSIELQAGRWQAAGSSDTMASCNQILVELTSSRTFQYKLENVDGVYDLKVVGYWRII